MYRMLCDGCNNLPSKCSCNRPSEIETLKAENERLKKELSAGDELRVDLLRQSAKQIDKLKAENESKSDVIERLQRKIVRISDSRENLKRRVSELKKGWLDDLEKENERLKKRIDYLEGYIKMLKDNEVSEVIGEVV